MDVLLAQPVFILPLLMIGGPIVLAAVLWHHDRESR